MRILESLSLLLPQRKNAKPLEFPPGSDLPSTPSGDKYTNASTRNGMTNKTRAAVPMAPLAK